MLLFEGVNQTIHISLLENTSEEYFLVNEFNEISVKGHNSLKKPSKDLNYGDDFSMKIQDKHLGGVDVTVLLGS